MSTETKTQHTPGPQFDFSALQAEIGRGVLLCEAAREGGHSGHKWELLAGERYQRCTQCGALGVVWNPETGKLAER